MSEKEKSGIAVKERVNVKKPPLYVVIMQYDDYTTIEFVVSILIEVFGKKHGEAMNIMLDVHKKGAGICGVFTREIAETKVALANTRAREAGFPLKCTMQRE